jgi:UPF0271 protein
VHDTRSVDLNCDLGESYGPYTMGLDEEVMPYITSANIACGFHAGDPLTMEKTVTLALKQRVAVGAHPGYPDLLGFGRRDMYLAPAETTAYIIYQISALRGFVEAAGGILQHVKPHGALYNMAAKDLELARAIVKGIALVDRELILVALAGSLLYRAGKETGLRVASEVFADRAYAPDGSLVPRGKQGAMIKDPQAAALRVERMVTEGKVTAITGEDLEVQADTVCIHGDTPGAVLFAREIKQHLVLAGIEVIPMGRIFASARE